MSSRPWRPLFRALPSLAEAIRIGTGDAFAAGVLHRWLAGGDVRSMAEGGLALAALKHSMPGDMCLASPAMLESFHAGGADVRR